MVGKHKDLNTFRLLQRAFVKSLLKSQDSWEDVKGDIPKKKELDWFVTSALAHHIREAKAEPAHEDNFVLRLLSHPALVVCTSAFEAIGLEAGETIVKLHSSKSDHWKAAQLLKLAVQHLSSISKSKRKELAQVGVYYM